jgi:hypothetical protein
MNLSALAKASAPTGFCCFTRSACHARTLRASILASTVVRHARMTTLPERKRSANLPSHRFTPCAGMSRLMSAHSTCAESYHVEGRVVSWLPRRFLYLDKRSAPCLPITAIWQEPERMANPPRKKRVSD